MMKSIIVFIALCVAATLASPPHLTRSEPEPVHILRYESDNIGVGPYNYAFETSDGQKREEHGELRHVGSEQEGIAVHGSYSYVVDGVTFTVNYVADENGFQPDGAHLPRV